MRRRRARLPILLLLVLFVMADLAIGLLLIPRRQGPTDLVKSILPAAQVLAYSQVSVAAVWLALGVRSVSAPWRLVGAWVVIFFWGRVLRIMAALRDWDLFSSGLTLTFVAQAAAIAITLLAARYAGFALADNPSNLRPDEAGPRSFRFSLRTLLWGTAAAAFCMATSRLLIHYYRVTELPQALVLRPAVWGVGHAVIGLVAVWAVLGSRWLVARLLLPWPVIVAATPLLTYTGGYDWLPGPAWSNWPTLLLTAFAEGLLVMISLAAVRLSGLRLVRQQPGGYHAQ
jgi:hypothetical protein